MQVMKYIRSLCTPAFIYFVIASIAYVSMVVENVGNKNIFCVGKKSCKVPSTLAMFVGHAIYIGFWVFLLNFLCQKGYRSLSWFILILPFILGIAALVLLFAFAESTVVSIEQAKELHSKAFEYAY